MRRACSMEMTTVCYRKKERDRWLREEVIGNVEKKVLRMDCSAFGGGIAWQSMADDSDITPAILLQHMQAMERRIMQYLEMRFTKVDARFDEIEARLSQLERKVELLSVQIGNLDERLDDLEVVQIPMLKKAVGIAA